MSFYIKWISENGKWAIWNIKKDNTISYVTVMDRSTRKDYIVKIEYKNNNHVVADKIIPNYVKSKVLEFTL